MRNRPENLPSQPVVADTRQFKGRVQEGQSAGEAGPERVRLLTGNPFAGALVRVGPLGALALFRPVRKTGQPETKIQKLPALNGSFAVAVAHATPREINLWSFLLRE
jgi:hypothetical protein